jgi:hypothetical protein
VISTNSKYAAAIDVAIDAVQYHFLGAVLRFDQAIPECAPSQSCGSRSGLLSIEGFIEATAHCTAEAFQVGVAEGIHLTPT